MNNEEVELKFSKPFLALSMIEAKMLGAIDSGSIPQVDILLDLDRVEVERYLLEVVDE